MLGSQNVLNYIIKMSLIRYIFGANLTHFGPESGQFDKDYFMQGVHISNSAFYSEVKTLITATFFRFKLKRNTL